MLAKKSYFQLLARCIECSTVQYKPERQHTQKWNKVREGEVYITEGSGLRCTPGCGGNEERGNTHKPSQASTTMMQYKEV